MRWFVVAFMAVVAAGRVGASEPVAVSMPVTEAPLPVVVRDLAPPSPIASLSTQIKTAPEIKQVAKKVASKGKLKKSMLSRSARNQLVLLAAAKPASKRPSYLAFLDGDDAETGADDLDLHRFFSRPKPVKVGDTDDDDDSMISDHVRLRLFLARMKAMEAHGMAMAAAQADQDDSELSDAVKLRLLIARTAAVQAHQKKHS